MLTNKQLLLIEYMITNPKATQEQLAEMVGASRKTIGRWCKLEEFQNELKTQLKDVWGDLERNAINTMKNLVDEGSFQASKYVLDSLGYAPAQKIEADVKTDIVINIEE